MADAVSASSSPVIAAPTPAGGASILARLGVFARDIKIAHTVFALPFALLATFLAAGGMPRAGQLGLILLCMASARTVAMSSNRLLDAELDARNLRTAGRAIPSGRLSRGFFRAILAACAMAFVGSTALFRVVYANPWPLYLSGPVLLFLGAYPLLKRFTRLCHYYLGAALGLAPICAWVAIAGHVSLTPLLMGAAVLLWTAGFDIIYACQDYHSDLETGVVSVPARIGIGPALRVARVTHGLSAGLLIAVGASSPQLGAIYFVGSGMAVALLIMQHAMVRAEDMSRAPVAFATMNGMLSTVVGTLGIIDVFV